MLSTGRAVSGATPKNLAQLGARATAQFRRSDVHRMRCIWHTVETAKRHTYTRATARRKYLLFSSVSVTRLAPFTKYFRRSRLPALLTKLAAAVPWYLALYTFTRTALAAADTARVQVSGSALIVRAAADQRASEV